MLGKGFSLESARPKIASKLTLFRNFILNIFNKKSSEINSTHLAYPILIPNISYVTKILHRDEKEKLKKIKEIIIIFVLSQKCCERVSLNFSRKVLIGFDLFESVSEEKMLDHMLVYFALISAFVSYQTLRYFLSFLFIYFI